MGKWTDVRAAPLGRGTMTAVYRRGRFDLLNVFEKRARFFNGAEVEQFSVKRYGYKGDLAFVEINFDVITDGP